MTRHDQLMVIAMEECAELAQRLSKALRFGLQQIQQDANDKPEENPDRLTNEQRIYREYWDLRAVLGMCEIDAWSSTAESRSYERSKAERVERYLERSAHLGRVLMARHTVRCLDDDLENDLAHFDAATADICAGCGTSDTVCSGYRKHGQMCCPDCDHLKDRRPAVVSDRPVE